MFDWFLFCSTYLTIGEWLNMVSTKDLFCWQKFMQDVPPKHPNLWWYFWFPNLTPNNIPWTTCLIYVYLNPISLKQSICRFNWVFSMFLWLPSPHIRVALSHQYMQNCINIYWNFDDRVETLAHIFWIVNGGCSAFSLRRWKWVIYKVIQHLWKGKIEMHLSYITTHGWTNALSHSVPRQHTIDLQPS
jgi:hypothetical protein